MGKKRIYQLPEATSIASSDLFIVEIDPLGTPITKKIKKENAQIPFDLDSATPLNNVRRIRHSDWNFIANSSMEAWLSGDNQPPNSWYLQGTASINKSNESVQGSYSAQLTFGAASDGNLFAIFGANNVVDYTYSAYVKRVSGSGIARMVAQQNFSPYNEEKQVAMPATGNWELVTLTFKPNSNGNYRIGFKASNADGSVWLIDEVKVQESKGIATTWTPCFINDSFFQNIFAKKHFNVPIQISGIPIYANNTAAIAGGLSVGDLYRTGYDPDFVCVVK